MIREVLGGVVERRVGPAGERVGGLGRGSSGVHRPAVAGPVG